MKILDKLISEKGINKSLLSRESTIPYTTIDGWYKKGYDNVRLSSLKKLSAYFGVSIDYLVGNEAFEEQLTPAQKEFLRKYSSLDTRGAEVVNIVLDAEYSRALDSRSMLRRLRSEYTDMPPKEYFVAESDDE
ncbi:MAG: helix-turn-helix transcriptional regulator [Clostridia bacterium]|nr:helix-turn-helix transcriptional regulator [Clostridia bacterium]